MEFTGKEKAMRYSLRLTLVALVLLAYGNSPLNAQIITSSMVGEVTDSSAAAVPNAQITVTNAGTGIPTRGSTGSSGTYTIPDLQPGTYNLTVTKSGFKTYHVAGVQVLAAQTVRVDIRLEVGNVQQEITVTAQAPLVNTEGAEIGEKVSLRQIMDLPFQQQSIDGLMVMAPGLQVPGPAPQMGGATHNGGSIFTINGIQANDIGNGGAAYSYGMGLINLPALESLQEFKLDAYNMSAEYQTVGTVTMVTKAGTNKFHGEAYEYLENKDLNANTFLNNAHVLPRSPFVRNQFAANVGGPILRDKLFFFVDYAGLRQRQYSAVQLNFPTMQMRQGDFSALSTQLYNPFTGQAFANNNLSSLITSQAKTLLNYLPPPTSIFAGMGLPSASPDYYGLVATAQDMNGVDLRIDYRISSKDALYGVYTRNVGSPWSVAGGGPPTYGNTSDRGYRTYSYSLVESHTFNPRALNDFRLAWFDHGAVITGQNLDINPQSLFPQFQPSAGRGLPSMTMTGYPTMFNDAGKGDYNHGVAAQLTDNFTYIRGRHTMKAGISIADYRSYSPNPKSALPSFSFNGQWTGNKGWPGQPQSQGNAFADFLIGTANTSTQSTTPVLEAVYWSWDREFYAQDAWQASPRLTLTYGLRYSLQSPWRWQDGLSTYWDPKTNQLALPENSATPTLPPFAASAAQFAAYPFTTTQALGLPEFYMKTDTNNWAPRFGFAYRPFSNNRTVVRGGYGIYYNWNDAFAGSRDDYLNPPWLTSTSSSYNTLLTGTTTYLPDITFSNPFPAALQKVAGVAPNPTLFSMQRDFQNPMAQQWNLTLEHQFTQNWAGRASYVGSKTDHVQWFFGDFNVPMTQTPNKTTQQQRPFQPWGAIDSTRSGAKQNLEQLQLEATRRLASGFSFQAEYQWTRSLDNVEQSGGPQNPNFPNLDYSNSFYIRRHVLVFNYLCELPFGKGKPLLSNTGKVGNALVGGWEVTGITTYETGTPVTLSFQVPSSKVGWWGGRPDRVSSNLYQGQSGSHDVISGVQWFNPAAFAPPQPWTWGNSPREVLFGPGFVNWDIGVMKSFRVGEHTRVELRSDFLNALNHFTPGAPSTTVGDTRDGGPAVTTTGKILTGSGSRVIQVGARILF